MSPSFKSLSRTSAPKSADLRANFQNNIRQTHKKRNYSADYEKNAPHVVMWTGEIAKISYVIKEENDP